MKKQKTNWNKLWPIANILNETCHGINISNFKSETEFEYEEIYFLLRKISDYETEEHQSEKEIEIELNEKEIKIIKRCFNEVLKQIEEWEFSTRIGIPIQETVKIMRKLTYDKQN